MTLIIPQRELELIRLHSRESQPIEACGILIGTTSGDARTVIEARSAGNRLSSESSYEIDPENLLRAFNDAERRGLDVVGFYHSHPFWSAEPSLTDKARANYPGLSYVIYSVPRNETMSFYFDGSQLLQEPVETVP